MDKIKKISRTNNNFIIEIPGTKFQREMGCTWAECHLQCTCQFADTNDQYNLAKDYYVNHYDIWN